MKWRVRATRAAYSQFGPATAFCKSMGKELIWNSKESAKAYADRMNVTCRATAVSYREEPIR